MTTTYNQVAIKSYEMDGIPSTTQIVARQLAFSGVTLDDIHHCTFITQIWGEYTPYKTADASVTAWGVFPSCHYDREGHIDKLAVQFAILDGNNTKGVILVFTNGDGRSVYVERFARYYKTAKSLNTKFYTMAADGSISQANSPTEWVPNDNGIGYRANGIRIHGMSPVNTESLLAFPGANLAMLKNLSADSFVAGYRVGVWEDVPATNSVANYVGTWSDGNGVLQKIAVQIKHKTQDKVAVFALTNGVGGVYAQQVLGVSGAGDKQVFQFDGSGNISKNSNGANQGAGKYAIQEFYIVPQELPPCVTKTPNKTKVFSDPSRTLTLDDIKDGIFTARMCGAWISQGFRNSPDSATGYNKKVYEDDGGSVTNIIVEFQVCDGSTKCLVVSFENGEGGVYASAVNARYSSDAVGYTYRDYDGTLHGAQNNSAGEIVAETFSVNGYGVFDMRVAVPAAKWILDADKTWSVLRDGETLATDDVVGITVTDSDAVLTVDEDVCLERIEFTDGFGATLSVASGNTVTAERIGGIGCILNNGTIVKRGEGTVLMPFNTASTGVTIVSNGTLKVASVAGSGDAYTIRVTNGATFDTNGLSENTVNVVLEGGAKLVNSNAAIGTNKKQTTRLALEGDATATASQNFGLIGSGFSATTLALGSNTLTLDGTAGFWLCNTTITGDGTVAVNGGTVQCLYGDSSHHDNVIGTDCTMNIGASGKLRIDNDLSLTVKNFCNGGTIIAPFKSGNTWYAQGTLVVTGELTSGNAIPILTLADGATVKATGTAQTVSTTFNASGAITIDASEITADDLKNATDGRIPVLTVPSSFNTGSATWSLYCPNANGSLRWVTNDGGSTKTLYLSQLKGLVFIIQ